MESPVAVLKMGLLTNMGIMLSLVSPCCVMFYTMMMFHGVVIPHFQQRSSLILCVVEFIYSGTKKVSSCLHTPFDTLQDVPNICWC